MTESPPSAAQPTRPEAEGWVGFELDEIGGSPVGRVHSVFLDATGGEPAWLVVALEQRGFLRRRRRPVLVTAPVRDCAGAAGRVWAAHSRETLLGAPPVDPTRPLLREHELTICAHYGIGERVGRAAEVVNRDESSVTARPSGA